MLDLHKPQRMSDDFLFTPISWFINTREPENMKAMFEDEDWLEYFPYK